jgi:carbon storage regulator CsrA
MLVLTRKLQEEICIGNQIKIKLLRINGSSVRIGIEAPRDVRIVRGELEDHGVELELPIEAFDLRSDTREVAENIAGSPQIPDGRCAAQRTRRWSSPGLEKSSTLSLLAARCTESPRRNAG